MSAASSMPAVISPAATLKTLSQANQVFKEDKDFFSFIADLKPDALHALLEEEELDGLLGFDPLSNAPGFSESRIQHLFQDQRVFIKLLDSEEKAGQAKMICNHVVAGHIIYLVTKLSPEVLARFFNHFACSGMSKLPDTLHPAVNAKILEYILTESSWQNPDLLFVGQQLIDRWLFWVAKSFPQTAEIFRSAWPKRDAFSPVLIHALHRHKQIFVGGSNSALNDEICAWLLEKVTASVFVAASAAALTVDQKASPATAQSAAVKVAGKLPSHSIVTLKGTVLDLKMSEDLFMSFLWCEGTKTESLATFIAEQKGKSTDAFVARLYQYYEQVVGFTTHPDIKATPAFINAWRTGEIDEAIANKIKACVGRRSVSFFNPNHVNKLLEKLDGKATHDPCKKFQELLEIMKKATSPDENPSARRSPKTQKLYDDIKAEYFTGDAVLYRSGAAPTVG